MYVYRATAASVRVKWGPQFGDPGPLISLVTGASRNISCRHGMCNQAVVAAFSELYFAHGTLAGKATQRLVLRVTVLI